MNAKQIEVSYTALYEVEANLNLHLKNSLALATQQLQDMRLHLVSANEEIERLTVEVREVENRAAAAIQPVTVDVEAIKKDLAQMVRLSTALMNATAKFDDAASKDAHYDLKRFLGDLVEVN